MMRNVNENRLISSIDYNRQRAAQPKPVRQPYEQVRVWRPANVDQIDFQKLTFTPATSTFDFGAAVRRVETQFLS